MTSRGQAALRQDGDGPLFTDEQQAQQPVERVVVVSPGKFSKMGLLPVGVVLAVVAAGLWGAWVTKSVLAGADMPPMARIQLSSLVGEYVQAQARSSTAPEQVTAETKAFMGEIERNLDARAKQGQVVLVSEAVLTKNVPDITAEVRRQVFAKVRMPQVAQMGASQVLGAMQEVMAAPAQGAGAIGPGNGN